MMRARIIGLAFNGKFLTAQPTGVHRVAYELIAAMDELAFEAGGRVLPARILAPRGGINSRKYARTAIEQIGVNRAQAWEQFDLPWQARHELIVSLCNLGPAYARNAITMIHDAQVYITPHSYRRLFRIWYKAMLPLIGRTNRRIITVSEFSRQQLSHFGVAPYDKIDVIHNGVDHILRNISDLSAFEELGLRGGQYVVALANSQAHKNIALLLEAFRSGALSDKKLVLVGSADAAEFSSKFGSFSDNVIFAGRVSDGELRALLERAHCLAFPSRTEGFGLPPLEAMLLGCPVIVAPCGALPEVCGEAALYAGPDDPAAWISNILLLEDKARRDALINAGRAHAASFTWKRAAEQMLDLLDRVIGPHRE